MASGYAVPFWDDGMFWNQTVVMVVPFYKHANDYSALKMSKFYGT